MRTAAAWVWTLPGLAWLGGLALLQQCESLPGKGALLALGAAMVAWFVAALYWRAALLPAVLLLAFTQGAWRAQMRLNEALDPAWEGRDIWVSGRIDSLPSRVQGQGGSAGWRFEFALDEAHAGPSQQDPPLALPPRLLLSDYAAPGEAPRALHAGERWQWQVRLKRPHGTVNPQGFDAELWFFEQDLRATGSVRPGAASRLLEDSPWWSVDRLRQRMRDALQREVPDASESGVLAGLSIGDQAAIGARDWGLLRRTGVAHLLAVSGSHITMFAWLAQALVSWLWRRSARLCLAVPAPRAAMWGGVLAALAYSLFSGWGVPAQRTVWMLVSLAVLRQLGVRWPWALCLLASAVVVTVVDPFAVSQAGFWLSFAAVALLMSGSNSHTGWREMLHAQWVATLGLAPLGLLFFQQISVVGLAANLIAVPLVGFVITPLALLGALWAPLWLVGAWLAQVLLAWLHLLDGFAMAVWFVPVAPMWAQMAGLAGGALLVLPLPWRMRACGLGLLVPLLWPAPWRPSQGQVQLLAADIGQGTAVLIRTSQHDLLFDTGPQLAPDVDAGQRVLLPLLHAWGVQRLDVLMLSHRDLDHVGGAASVMAGMPVSRLLSSLEEDHPLLKIVPHERCVAGQQWVWDGVRFEVLHPPPQRYAQAAKPNTLSCLLRVVAANGRAALMTGDIEAPQERELVQSGVDLRSELLMAPHHGSKTSSSDAFLDAVQPRLAVVQAGYRNRFGHPPLPILARYQAHDIAVLTSPDCGALDWRSDLPGWRCERAEHPRYWFTRPLATAALGPVQAEPKTEEPTEND